MNVAEKDSIYRGRFIMAGEPLPAELSKLTPAEPTLALVSSYSDMSVAQLNELVESLGIEISEGSGKGGTVLKADLISALEQFDAEDSEEEDSEEEE